MLWGITITNKNGIYLDILINSKLHVTQTYKYGWLVGCFGLSGPLRQYFSLYRAVSQREGERKENL